MEIYTHRQFLRKSSQAATLSPEKSLWEIIALFQDIQFYWGEKPRPDLAREETSYMLSNVSLVISPNLNH